VEVGKKCRCKKRDWPVRNQQQQVALPSGVEIKDGGLKASSHENRDRLPHGPLKLS